jgi:acyl-CoA thioester hydrolase
VGREDIVETTFPVRYAESDQMGIVHHANYLVWMEEGRSQFMRAKGLGYEQIERTGAASAVTEVTVRYLAPARYGDTVTVRSWIDAARSRTVTFGYEIVNADSRAVLATGQVKLVWIDRQGQVTRMPDAVRALALG